MSIESDTEGFISSTPSATAPTTPRFVPSSVHPGPNPARIITADTRIVGECPNCGKGQFVLCVSDTSICGGCGNVLATPSPEPEIPAKIGSLIRSLVQNHAFAITGKVQLKPSGNDEYHSLILHRRHENISYCCQMLWRRAHAVHDDRSLDSWLQSRKRAERKFNLWATRHGFGGPMQEVVAALHDMNLGMDTGMIVDSTNIKSRQSSESSALPPARLFFRQERVIGDLKKELGSAHISSEYSYLRFEFAWRPFDGECKLRQLAECALREAGDLRDSAIRLLGGESVIAAKGDRRIPFGRGGSDSISLEEALRHATEPLEHAESSLAMQDWEMVIELCQRCNSFTNYLFGAVGKLA